MATPSISPPRKLFALLRYLNIDQNGLAAHLGVSHTLVSFWVHGKAPIPEKHHAGIDTLIRETWDAIFEDWQQKANETGVAYRARARESGEEEASVSDAVRAAHAIWRSTLEAWHAATETYISLLEEARIEAEVLSGDLYRSLYLACRTLGIYGMRQPHPLAADERDEMRRASLIVQEALRRLGRLESPSLDTQLAYQRQVLEQKLQEVG